MQQIQQLAAAGIGQGLEQQVGVMGAIGHGGTGKYSLALIIRK
jgi:hypothetical protein